jgi:molybdopterin-containing oxidoreductase family membrane subunit
VAGAIFSGIAALIVVMAVLRKFLHLEEYLRPLHFQNLGKLLLLMSLLWGYFVFNERLTAWYGNSPHEMNVFWSTQTGDYSPLFWTMVLCNFVIPFPLLAIRKLRSITTAVIASCCVVAGMWLERFLIIVPSLARKSTPYSWGRYSPEWPEIVIMIASFATMALLYVLVSKLVPLISIWELKVGEHPTEKTAAAVREAEAAGELL